MGCRSREILTLSHLYGSNSKNPACHTSNYATGPPVCNTDFLRYFWKFSQSHRRYYKTLILKTQNDIQLQLSLFWPWCELAPTSIWELLSVSSADSRPGKPSGSSCSGSWSCSWLALLLSMLRGFGGSHLLHRWLYSFTSTAASSSPACPCTYE